MTTTLEAADVAEAALIVDALVPPSVVAVLILVEDVVLICEFMMAYRSDEALTAQWQVDWEKNQIGKSKRSEI